MSDIPDKIKELEDLIAKTKYNKSTEKAIGMYKAQLAKFREKQAFRSAKKFKAEGYAVRKTGDATVVLLGFPSVGKSTLLNAITDAKSKVAAYEFTTLSVIPGVLDQDGVKVQVLDVPGIVTGAASGKGRGKEVLSIIRNVDLVLIMIDVNNPEHYDAILREINETGVRINKKKPDVRITKKSKDGLRIGATLKLNISQNTMKDILKEFKITNADVLIRSQVDLDSFIDAVEGNKIYIPAITLLSKIDMIDESKLREIRKKIKPDIEISAEKKIGLDELKKLIIKKLDIVKIYTKEISKAADMNEPMIIKRPATIRDVCLHIHKDFVNKFKFAKVWGKSTKFEGQRFMLDHKLEDGDIVEIHLI